MHFVNRCSLTIADSPTPFQTLDGAQPAFAASTFNELLGMLSARDAGTQNLPAANPAPVVVAARENTPTSDVAVVPENVLGV
jgi:hypothetical protein